MALKFHLFAHFLRIAVAVAAIAPWILLGINANAQIAVRQPVEPVGAVLHPYGFHPAQGTISAGQILLVFHNRTGFEELEFAIERGATSSVTRETVNSVTAKRGKRKLREIVDLPVGEYVISVGGHPDWLFHLTVTRD